MSDALSKPLKIPHLAIVRAPGLLPMLYTPSELGNELGIPVRTLRDWVARDMPHERDNQDRIWINGRDFAAWVETVRLARLEPKLQADEAYCLRCRKPVKLTKPKSRVEGKRRLLEGVCPECGGIIHRVSRNGQ